MNEEREPAVSRTAAPETRLLDAEAARALSERALADARATVQAYLRQAEVLKHAALAAARTLLEGEPLAAPLLARVEPTDLVRSAPSLDALAAEPFQAMDHLVAEQRRSLDEALSRFMLGHVPGAPALATEPDARVT